MSRALALATLIGCYSPTIHPGKPCADGICPNELICTHAGTCQLVDSDAPLGDAPIAIDAPAIDAALDGPTPEFCYGTGLARPCFSGMAPTGTIAITADVDTNGPLCDGRFAGECVIGAAVIAVSTYANVIGSRPLVMVATATISIAAGAALDASASGTMPGPGGRTAGCMGSAPADFSGGAGGTFGSRGGNGGASTSGAPTIGAGVVPVTQLEGGCVGGSGGGLVFGKGGGGGGAMELIAGSAIAIDGILDGSGGGGGGGMNQSGGGGGGAGGLIGLDAPSILFGSSGIIYANGGGGGEGAGLNMGTPGADPTMPNVAAAGGAGTAQFAGDGGIGSVGATLAAVGGDATAAGAGGGGGGGGAGIIRTFGGATLPVTTNISPPAN